MTKERKILLKYLLKQYKQSKQLIVQSDAKWMLYDIKNLGYKKAKISKIGEVFNSIISKVYEVQYHASNISNLRYAYKQPIRIKQGQEFIYVPQLDLGIILSGTIWKAIEHPGGYFDF